MDPDKALPEVPFSEMFDTVTAEDSQKQTLEHFQRLHGPAENPWTRPPNRGEEVIQDDAALENILQKRAPAEKDGDKRDEWEFVRAADGSIERAWIRGKVDPATAFERIQLE